MLIDPINRYGKLAQEFRRSGVSMMETCLVEASAKSLDLQILGTNARRLQLLLRISSTFLQMLRGSLSRPLELEQSPRECLAHQFPTPWVHCPSHQQRRTLLPIL